MNISIIYHTSRALCRTTISNSMDHDFSCYDCDIFTCIATATKTSAFSAFSVVKNHVPYDKYQVIFPYITNKCQFFH